MTCPECGMTLVLMLGCAPWAASASASAARRRRFRLSASAAFPSPGPGRWHTSQRAGRNSAP